PLAPVVAADGAVGQGRHQGVDAAAEVGGRVAADGAVGQGHVVGVDAAAVAVCGVAADGAVGQIRRAGDDTAGGAEGVGGLVAADGAVGQGHDVGEDAAGEAAGGVAPHRAPVEPERAALVLVVADEVDAAAILERGVVSHDGADQGEVAGAGGLPVGDGAPAP